MRSFWSGGGSPASPRRFRSKTTTPGRRLRPRRGEGEEAVESEERYDWSDERTATRTRFEGRRAKGKGEAGIAPHDAARCQSPPAHPFSSSREPRSSLPHNHRPTLPHRVITAEYIASANIGAAGRRPASRRGGGIERQGLARH